jgi:hypothetical protein
MLLLVCTLADIRNHSTITLLSIGCYPKARSMVSVVVILYVHHVARVQQITNPGWIVISTHAWWACENTISRLAHTR